MENYFDVPKILGQESGVKTIGGASTPLNRLCRCPWIYAQYFVNRFHQSKIIGVWCPESCAQTHAQLSVANDNLMMSEASQVMRQTIAELWFLHYPVALLIDKPVTAWAPRALSLSLSLSGYVPEQSLC